MNLPYALSVPVTYVFVCRKGDLNFNKINHLPVFDDLPTTSIWLTLSLTVLERLSHITSENL